MALIRLHTLDGCSLAIGRYPRFRYNASAGGGVGVLDPTTNAAEQSIRFPLEQLSIPPLNSRTARFLGLPLPPGLQVSIEPVRLEGTIHPHSGAVQLHFQARFQFSAGGLYRPPSLWVDTLLTSATPSGSPHPRWGVLAGEPYCQHAQTCVLVGLAPIQPSGDGWLDRFLGLPDEALALLRCALITS
jgi:hypothetical protein